MTVWLSGFKADITKAGAGVMTNSVLPAGSNPVTVFGEQESGE